MRTPAILTFAVGVVFGTACSSPSVTNSENNSIANNHNLVDVGSTNSGTSCEATSVDSETGARSAHDCHPTTGGYRCFCDGAESTSTADDCETALAEECGVTDRELDACSPSSSSICFPEEDGTYSCQCNEDELLQTMEGDSCDDAGWLGCNEPCSVGADSCAPTTTPGPGAWDCTCDSYYAATRTKYLSGGECADAVRAICRPGSFDGCNGWAGYCDQVESPEFGFDCVCLDGETAFITPDQIGNQDDCESAVEAACGPNEPPEGYYCESTSGSLRAECTQSLNDDGAAVYVCTCYDTSGTNAATTGQEVATDDCDTALDEACGL